MNANRAIGLLACLLCCTGLASAVTLDGAFTTTGPFDSQCNPAPKASSFLTTDEAVWLYVSVSNAAAGDVLRTTWVQPDGATYVTSSWNPLPEAGGYCFSDTIGVAGNDAVNHPGNWTIRGTWNGTSLFSVNFTLTKPGGGSGTAPAISAGGIVNAASFIPASLPAGAIARGSYFSIFGTNLGPGKGLSQTSYPLPTMLSEVNVRISQGSNAVNAYLAYVSATQINAIMPSNAPIGDVQVVVTYRGQASIGATLKIAASNFGIFSTSNGQGPGIIQNYVGTGQVPLNTRSATAKPGQVVILLGTGLGAITGPDNQKPPVGDMPGTIQVTVEGKAATKLYAGRMPDVAGVDQINFQVPMDAPTGCYVPVQVRMGNTYSNIVTMAIHPTGQACSDSQNPFGDLVAKGRKGGSIFLVRAAVTAQIDPGQAPLDLTLDLGIGAFEENTGQGDLGFSPLFSLPPVGTCTSYSGNFDLGSLLGGDPTSTASGFLGILGRELDAGASLSITGPRGNTISMPHMDTEKNTGPYIALLGGSSPLDTSSTLPPFLDPGTFRVTGLGGKDVGPFSASVIIGSPVTWTDKITQFDRNAPLTLHWTGGDASKMVLIGGASINSTSKAAAMFFCFVPSAPNTFTVPVSAMANLPPTLGVENALGAVIFGSFPSGNFTTFKATGIDSGLIFNAALAAKMLGIQ